MAVWPLLAVTKTGLALGGAGRVAVGLVGSATRSSVVGAAASPAAAATQLFARLQQLHLALAAAVFATGRLFVMLLLHCAQQLR